MKFKIRGQPEDSEKGGTYIRKGYESVREREREREREKHNDKGHRERERKAIRAITKNK